MEVCKQSAYVCHAGSDAYKKYDTLYELLVAEIWGAYGRQMDDSDSTFQRGLFLEDALRFRTEIKEIPLVYVGGLVSREKIDEVLDDGFEFVQMGRALLNEPGFVNRLRTEEKARCNCGHSNYCIARMYTIDMACHKHLEEKLPLCLEREIEKLENQ